MVIDLKNFLRSINVLRIGIMLAFVAAILMGINLVYYMFFFQISASILWTCGIIGIGLYLFKGKEAEREAKEIPFIKEKIEKRTTHPIEEEKKRIHTKPRTTNKRQKRRSGKSEMKSAKKKK